MFEKFKDGFSDLIEQLRAIEDKPEIAKDTAHELRKREIEHVSGPMFTFQAILLKSE